MSQENKEVYFLRQAMMAFTLDGPALNQLFVFPLIRRDLNNHVIVSSDSLKSLWINLLCLYREADKSALPAIC